MSPGKTTLVMLAAAILVACSGGPTDDPRSHSVGLVDSPPLPTLVLEDFQNAAEGCEGRLDGTEEFGITQTDALVVARHGTDAVCIDTLEAVSLELEALGAGYAADELYSGFYAAIHLSQVQDWATPASEDLDGGGEASGDPNPQPNDPTLSPTMGDPNPQPNMPGAQPQIGTDPTPSMPDTGDPSVDPRPTPDAEDVPETPVVVIENTALPGI
jgi:hypothetical protein